MKEMEVLPGDRIDLACERLVADAPAFMMFNDTRTEAHVGDTVQSVYERWCAARPSTEPVDLRLERKARPRAWSTDPQRRAVMQVKLEVEALAMHLGDEAILAMRQRMPDVLRRAGHAAGMAVDDPWLTKGVTDWCGKAGLAGDEVPLTRQRAARDQATIDLRRVHRAAKALLADPTSEARRAELAVVVEMADETNQCGCTCLAVTEMIEGSEVCVGRARRRDCPKHGGGA